MSHSKKPLFSALFLGVLALAGLGAQTPPTGAAFLAEDFARSSVLEKKREYLDLSAVPEPVVKFQRTALDDTATWLLNITVLPSDSKITVDGVLYTNGSASLENHRNLNPVLGIERSGYNGYSTTIHMEKGFKYDLAVSLAPKVGWLRIESGLPIHQVLLDHEPVEALAGTFQVGAGHHLLTVRSFGFKDIQTDLYIDEATVHEFKAAFAPAVFSAHSLAPSRTRFRPGNPGSLGTTTIKFTVTAPGIARLAILNQDQQPVATHDFAIFDTWDQSFTWNGQDDAGKSLAEGSYSWTITGQGAPAWGSPAFELLGSVAIDNSSFLKPRLSGHGGSGFQSAMDTYVLETGSFSVGTSLGYDLANQPESANPLFTLDAWLRGTPLPGLELTGGVQVGTETSADAQSAVFLYGGLKYQAVKPRAPEPTLSLAIGLEGTGIVSDTLPELRYLNGNMAGVAGSASLQFNGDIFFANLELGLALSPYTLFDSPTELSLIPRPTAGLGLGIDTDTIAVCLGARAEFLPLDYLVNGFSLAGASDTSTALATWGLLAPLRLTADIMLTSPWGMAFNIGGQASLYPASGFLDHAGLRLSILFLQ